MCTSATSSRGRLFSALHSLENALFLLDEAKVPSEIGAHLDGIVHKVLDLLIVPIDELDLERL